MNRYHPHGVNLTDAPAPQPPRHVTSMQPHDGKSRNNWSRSRSSVLATQPKRENSWLSRPIQADSSAAGCSKRLKIDRPNCRRSPRRSADTSGATLRGGWPGVQRA